MAGIHQGQGQIELEPTEIMTDTGTYTDGIFGIFWLLGDQAFLGPILMVELDGS